MKYQILILMVLSTLVHAEGLTFNERARTASFVWKCQTALAGIGVFDPEDQSEADKIEFLTSWAGEDLQKIGESQEGKILRRKMEDFLSVLEVLRSEEDIDLPDGWGKFENAEELAMLLTRKLKEIAEAANLALYLFKEYPDNNPRQ